MTDVNSAGYRELLRRFMEARTVAVVASSGHMLFRNMGAEIDAHGLVMRFNGAVTRGYQNDVGVGGDTGSNGDRDVRTAWSHGWRDALHSQQLGGDPVVGPNELLVQTAPGWGHRGFYYGARPAITINPSWARALHMDILGGEGNWPSTGFDTASEPQPGPQCGRREPVRRDGWPVPQAAGRVQRRVAPRGGGASACGVGVGLALAAPPRSFLAGPR